MKKKGNREKMTRKRKEEKEIMKQRNESKNKSEGQRMT